ncbi:MAG: hypothetical protein PWP65_9 [Clostridia bacterium]|nr:hypothetical protein [Clostridia bacterium]
MSWYGIKAGVPPQEVPAAVYYPVPGRQVSLIFTITNMYTPEDADRLVKVLERLNGVLGVVANLKERKLTVTYYTPPVTAELLAYTIGSAGYHYLQRI